MKHVTVTDSTSTMTSLELREIINAARAESGESKVRNDQFLVRIEDELEGDIQLPPLVEVENNQSLSPNNTSLTYIFTGAKGKRDTLVVIARLSPEFTATLVDRWEALEKENLHLLQENITAELTILQANAAP